MDGHNLTKRIKEDGELKALPVILFSSLITDKLRHKGEAVGADDQISKPDVSQLAMQLDDGPVETIADGRKNLFTAFAEVAKRGGRGYVGYLWPKPLPSGGVSKEAYPKLSYVALFRPWNWIVGTGLYVDDIESRVSRVRYGVLVMVFAWTSKACPT